MTFFNGLQTLEKLGYIVVVSLCWFFYLGTGIFAIDIGLLCFGFPRELWQKGSYVPFLFSKPIWPYEVTKNWDLRNKSWYQWIAFLCSAFLWALSHSLLSELGVDFLPIQCNHCGSINVYTE